MLFQFVEAIDKPIEGVTVAYKPTVLLAPARELGHALGITVGYDRQTKTLKMNGIGVHSSGVTLPDGTILVALRELSSLGATFGWSKEKGLATVSLKDKTAQVHFGRKRVLVEKSKQRLLAYQGSRLVLKSHVSTGRAGHHTPDGDFAIDWKERMHYSRKYDNSPMPWSAHIIEDIFFHGYESVPSVPASHGCIRLPMRGYNAAKWLWNWIEPGTTVKITGSWKARAAK